MPEKETFEKIVQKLEDHERRILELERSLSEGMKSEKIIKKISIQEYLRSKKPKTDVNKTLAICHYMEKYEDFEYYNKNDIEEHFKKAREPPPLNINDKVNSNIKKGYMMDADEKKDNLKCWCLTSSGIEFCENNFKKP